MKSLHWQFIREPTVSPQLDAEIRDLLVAAYPQHAELFGQSSFWGSQPAYRWLGREPGSDLLSAHLECGPRAVWVAGRPVSILGIGAVAVHPRLQGRGHGRAMFSALRQALPATVDADFGFLECRPAVAEFYRRAGFIQVLQACTSIDPDTGLWDTYTGPVMVLPIRRSMAGWPLGGEVNLRGLPR